MPTNVRPSSARAWSPLTGTRERPSGPSSASATRPRQPEDTPALPTAFQSMEGCLPGPRSLEPPVPEALRDLVEVVEGLERHAPLAEVASELARGENAVGSLGRAAVGVAVADVDDLGLAFELAD